MKYWDASALVPLLVEQPDTGHLRPVAEQDPQLITWAWSKVEIAGAVERLTRAGAIGRSERRQILARLEDLSRRWDEVTDLTAVRKRALSLLARHPLRAADAAQLGAALLVSDLGLPHLEFVCLDQRLSLAAEREGLIVHPSPG